MFNLPFPPDEFAARVNRGIVLSDGVTMMVADPVVITAAGQPEIRFLVAVTDGQSRSQQWEVAVPLDPLNFKVLPPDSFVNTVQANLEEWWFVKESV